MDSCRCQAIILSILLVTILHRNGYNHDFIYSTRKPWNHKQENHDLIYENVEMEEEWWTCKKTTWENEKKDEHEEEAPLSMNHLLFMEEASNRR